MHRSLLESIRGLPIQGILQGLGAGLATSRILIEGGGLPIGSAAWLAALIVGLALGQALVWLLRRWRLDTQPLWALWAGLVWPTMGLLAGLLLVVGLFLALFSIRQSLSGPWPEVMVLIGFLALYVATLSPTVLPADSGEFQLVSAVLGIAHPPGYPLYTMLGWLFSRLPLGDVAYRLNLYGAACGVLALGVVARAVRRISGSAALALVAAGALGLSTTFWATSTTANIRSMTALFTALSVDLLLAWGASRSTGHLTAFGLVFGLGIGHHSSLILLGLPFLAYILVTEPRLVMQPRRWIAALGALAASFLVLLYLPLRSLAGAAFDPSPIRTWSDFVSHILALGFQGDMFYFRDLPTLTTRAGIWQNIVRLEFGPILPAVILAAGVALMVRKWRLAVLLLGVAATNVLAALTYRAPQTVEYLIPSYVAMALVLGLGLAQFRFGDPWRHILVSWLIVVVLWGGLQNYASFRLLHGDTSARAYAEQIIADAPPEAIILANWHRVTPFWYLQQVEGRRPDIRVQYVYPEGSLPNEQVWLRRISEMVAERPVIITNWFPAFGGAEYTWTSFHGAWLVRREPIQEPPEPVVGRNAVFSDQIELLGYALDTPVLTPGNAVSVRVYWRPLRTLTQDYSSFVQLLGPSGVVGQGDLAHAAREILPGQLYVDTYQFPLLLQTLPGQYPLITGFYYAVGNGWQRLSAAGEDHLTLATLQVQAVDHSPVTRHPLSVQLAGGPQLVGVDWDRTVAGQTRAYLHWWQPRSLGRGDAVASGSGALLQIRDGERVVAEAGLPGLAPGSGITVVADLASQARRLSLAAREEDGTSRPWIGAWGVSLQAITLPSVPDGAHYVPLGGEMAFVGLDDLPRKLSRGANVPLRPLFLSLRPLLADYAVSVGLQGAENRWESKSDSIPALGAIPTLKWIRGWVVADPHVVAVPPDAAEGPASITLSVYDAFTLRPLNVLDDRLARRGQGTYLRLNEAPLE